MKGSFLFRLAVFIGALLYWTVIPSGCANIVPPSGGFRDSLPPVLIKAEPGDSAVNFRAKKISFTFDEYVDLKDVPANVLFTPVFQNSPPISVRGHTVSVDVPDSLPPNTTYIINFGNAIVDWNEGNVLKNFTYTFSTGPVLDSLTISGRVILAETGGVDTSLVAILHRSLDDSAVLRTTPQYIARLDRNGAFRFDHLPKDSFAIYVLSSNTRPWQYRDTTKLFAFAGQPVVAGEADSLLLYAYQYPSRSQTSPGAQNQRIPASDRRLRFNPPSGTQDLQGSFEISFPLPLRDFDSGRLQLSSDSSFAPVPFSARLDSSRTKLSITTKWKENTAYNLILDREFAADSNGRQLLKTDTLFFTTRKLSDYGGITLRFRNLDLSRRPLLQFVQNNVVAYSAPLSSNVYTASFLKPGDYNLRLVYDTNGNGKWDPGRFFGEKRQPELARPIERTISVKPSFDNEVEIVL